MITIEAAGEHAMVRMAGPKANAMTPAFLDALDRAIDELAERDLRAAVLIGAGRVFSAGLPLPDLIDLDRGAMRAFIDRFDSTMLRVLSSPTPLVAAINGHAIAGGCVLALMCDARIIAAGPATIGLSEARIGIGLPAVVVEGLRLRLANPAATELAVGGALVDAEAALRLGLVDAVVAADQLEARALERAAALGAGTRDARRQIKAALVRPTVDAIVATSADERELWLDTWFSADGQRLLREQVAKLTRK